MKNIIYLFSIIILCGCNDSNNKKSINSSISIDTTDFKQKLARRANDLFEKDEFLKAIICYDSLIMIDSSKAGYFFKRGYSKSMLLDKSGAIADYKKSIALNYSQKESSFQNIGALYYVQSKYDSALYYLNECLKINPENKTATSLKKEVVEYLSKNKI